MKILKNFGPIFILLVLVCSPAWTAHTPKSKKLKSKISPHKARRTHRRLNAGAPKNEGILKKLWNKGKMYGKKILTPRGTNVGLGMIVGSYLLRRSSNKKNQAKIRSLRDRLKLQTVEFQTTQGEREQLLKNIDRQILTLTSRMESMRRIISDKLEQFDGYVQARLGGMNYKDYMEKFRRNSF